MKTALLLAALLGASSAHAADKACSFDSSIGDLSVTYTDEGNGTSGLTFRLNDKEVGRAGGCHAENTLRRGTLRCPVFIDDDTRLEFYQSTFGPADKLVVKHSALIWSKLTTNSPRVETVVGRCEE